jgi:hypothetical protein
MARHSRSVLSALDHDPRRVARSTVHGIIHAPEARFRSSRLGA